MKKITLLHLYPRELNLYGDVGNAIALYYRLRKRGFNVDITECGIGDRFTDFDIMLIGGGQDREISIVENDLRRKSEAIAYCIESGKAVLAVCAGLQLLGSYYQTSEGRRISLCSALPYYTASSEKRLIGNIVTKSDYGTIVGFENHSGRTYPTGDIKPLGRVASGYGNNGRDDMEGFEYKNTFCTYLHGPVLPKNPLLADEIISRAVPEIKSMPLDDGLEQMCHRSLIKRFA